jgi:hypothetical protein
VEVTHNMNSTAQQLSQTPVLSIVGGLSTKKRHHLHLVFEGVCSHCAHCGQPLSDAVSIERGMGPVCSKKGYKEDPTDPDELQAMIDLAEYPDLVDFLTENYKPLGVRGLMNGLVRICSLNRKHDAFGACCEAIESLGYAKLASVLRESIAVVLLSEPDKHPGCYVVWVKRRDFTRYWGYDVKRIQGARQERGTRGIIVPKNDVSRRKLWEAMRRHYLGLVVKTPKGAFKITAPKPKPAPTPAPEPAPVASPPEPNPEPSPPVV